MAIALVQLVTTHSNTATVASTGSGNLIIVNAMWDSDSGADAISAITDNVGNFYVQAPNTLGSDHQSCSIWYAKNSISGATSIVIANTLSRLTQHVYEFSGADTSSPFDSGNNNAVNPGLPDSPSLTPSVPDELIITSIGSYGTVLTSVSSPWIGIFTNLSDSAGSAYIINPSLSLQQAIYLPNNINIYGMSIATFKAPPPPPLTLSLSDSISSSDSTIKEDDKLLSDSVIIVDSVNQARAASVSDSMTVTDSFVLQSDFIAPVQVPVVETLVNKLIPTEVKTYFNIVE